MQLLALNKFQGFNVDQVCVCSTKAVCNSANKTKANEDPNDWKKTSEMDSGGDNDLKTVFQYYSNSSQVNQR